MNREQWLNEGVQWVSVLFEAQGFSVPTDVKVTCSWPGGRAGKGKTIGQCWPRSLSSVGVNEIFISPIIDDSIKALDVLTHELIHAIDDCKSGHRGAFKVMMKAIGLEGKPTATIAGERLHGQLKEIANSIGEYPHKAVIVPPPKQKSRQLKLSCGDCGAVWRMSKQWLEQAICCPVCASSNIEVN